MADGQRDLADPNHLFPDHLRFMENSVLGFYQALFSSFQPGKSPSYFHYDDLPEFTEIEIEGRGTDNLKNVDKRPKIVVARGPVGWQNRGQGGGGFVGSQNLSIGKQRFADITSGTVSVSCFSRNDLEADRIAGICSDSVKMFRPVLQRLGFLTIHAAQIGQRGMVKSDAIPDLFVVPVVIQTEVTKNWNLEKVDPVQLRKIIVNLVTKP